MVKEIEKSARELQMGGIRAIKQQVNRKLESPIATGLFRHGKQLGPLMLEF